MAVGMNSSFLEMKFLLKFFCLNLLSLSLLCGITSGDVGSNLKEFFNVLIKMGKESFSINPLGKEFSDKSKKSKKMEKYLIK